MNLSAQSMLTFLNHQCHLYEVFEHISLVMEVSGVAPSSARTLPDLVGGSKGDNSGGGGSDNADSVGGGVISVIATATAVVGTPSTHLLQVSQSPSQPQASAPSQMHGTLYVCELPAGMWNSMGAVTATSAPSRRQLGFATEAAAFCTSQNLSFALEKDCAAGERPQSVQATTATPAATGAMDHTDYLEEMNGEQGGLGNGGGGFSASAADSCSVPAAEGIQLPQVYTPPEHSVMEFSVPLQEPQDAGEDRKQRSNATQMGLRETGGCSTPLELPPCQPSEADVAGASVQKQGQTATVVLWVAADAAASRAVAATEMGQVRSVSYTLAPAPLATSPGHRDSQCSASTATTSPRAAAAAGTPGRIAAGAGGSHPEAPGCLCFAVRDIEEAESNDTDLVTPRDRRVQMLTLQLEAGAVAYAAKSPSDALSRVVSNSPEYLFTSPLALGGGAATLSTYRPAPSSSFSFVFHKGGITRCVAALRQHSPGLVYACRGGRGSMPLFLPESANGATGADSTTGSSTSPSRGTTSLLEMPASQGTVRIGSVPMGLPSSPAPSFTGSAGASQTQPSEGEVYRWRRRLSTGALFRGRARGVGGLFTPYTSNQHCEAMSAAALNSPFTSTTPTSRASTVKQGVDRTGGLHGSRGKRGDTGTRAGASTANPQKALLDHSSGSSFEDLTDEMTAIRLGPCYAPPRPSLPLEGGSSAPSPVTAVDWEDVFDVSSEQQDRWQQVEDAAENPTTGTTASATVRSPAKRLNADRWRAFRRSVYERGGLADSEIRFEVWCYLLGAYAVGSTEAEQAEVIRTEEALYTCLTSQWKSFMPEQEAHFSAYRYAKHSIMKDVQRTERTHPAFREDDSDMLRVLRELLLAHVMLDMDLGYIQGMSDVAAVALLVTLSSLPEAAHPSPASEAAMFMCYRRILSEHMSTNFIIEERRADAPYAVVKGVQRKLYQVQVLTRHFYPSLYNHLKKNCMDENMSFAFRWILVCFKRDLPNIADTMRLWDVFFACPYTTSYEVVVAVALLGTLAAQILTHIHAYETLLQFANELSSGATLDQILVCARDFYENVCVVETRELRRRQRLGVADGGERVPGRNTVPYGLTAAPTIRAPAGEVNGAVDNSFPTVEEMTQLFLMTDGPL
ncbi:hypothetical protein CUR178_03346 [Leishmania enriettii]|uniref:Rab-GAP TBC domain-containing protein n=1 Tax=Leishmania enriettii TaxID=5663 RepID=A0A836KR21_LEIEN|nr:hypothetical protein CUR178_03346 [Leishmania enriettii]